MACRRSPARQIYSSSVAANTPTTASCDEYEEVWFDTDGGVAEVEGWRRQQRRRHFSHSLKWLGTLCYCTEEGGVKMFRQVAAPSLPEAANLAPIVQDVFQLPAGNEPHPL